MRWRRDRGQTATEYLMLLGLLTTISLAIVRLAGVPIRRVLQGALACVIDDCGSSYW